MRKFYYFLVAVFTMTALSSCVIDVESSTDYSVAEKSRDIAIFLHSPSCGYSCAALEYVETTYPNAALRVVDIDKKDNSFYLLAARQDYGLSKDKDIDTPVICFGSLYISGWDYDKRQQLDIYIQPYLKK